MPTGTASAGAVTLLLASSVTFGSDTATRPYYTAPSNSLTPLASVREAAHQRLGQRLDERNERDGPTQQPWNNWQNFQNWQNY